MKRNNLSLTVVLFVAVFLLAGVGPVRADDELSLFGVIQGIDEKEPSITVDVLSDSCPGTRTFTYNPADIAVPDNVQVIIGKKIRFVLDGPACSDQIMHAITGITIEQ